MDKKRERMKELTELLTKAGKAYYQESREIMSNFEYDRLYDELQKLEEETGIVLAGSPTRQVGYEVLEELPAIVALAQIFGDQHILARAAARLKRSRSAERFCRCP